MKKSAGEKVYESESETETDATVKNSTRERETNSYKIKRTSAPTMKLIVAQKYISRIFFCQTAWIRCVVCENDSETCMHKNDHALSAQFKH